MRPPFDVDAIDAMTPQVLAQGHRLLSTHMYGKNAQEHIALLLDQFHLPDAALVMDAGCGLGEVARLMREARGDLRFVLVNLSVAQLHWCFDNLKGPYLVLRADAHDTHLPPDFFDGVMFHSALCQMDEVGALREAWRVLRPGGMVLVNELVRVEGDGREMERTLACRTWPEESLCRVIETVGFDIDFVAHPEYDLSQFHEFLALNALEHLAEGVRPVIVTGVKR